MGYRAHVSLSRSQIRYTDPASYPSEPCFADECVPSRPLNVGEDPLSLRGWPAQSLDRLLGREPEWDPYDNKEHLAQMFQGEPQLRAVAERVLAEHAWGAWVWGGGEPGEPCWRVDYSGVNTDPVTYVLRDLANARRLVTKELRHSSGVEILLSDVLPSGHARPLWVLAGVETVGRYHDPAWERLLSGARINWDGELVGALSDFPLGRPT